MYKQIAKLLIYMPALLLTFAVSSCDESSEDGTGGVENPEEGGGVKTPEIHFTNAELIYMGDDDGVGTDLWYIKLYTDMQVDELAAPIGPGQLMQISLNTGLFAGDEPDPSVIGGEYKVQSSGEDFSENTFNCGTIDAIPMPNGTLHMPDHTFFGDLPAGSTEYDPDLIDSGNILVGYAADGTLTVSGLVAGNHFLKRKFDYAGKPKIVDRSTEIVPNSTLTQDITDLSMLTQTRLWDKGDSFMVGDESYRLFQIFLAEPTVDLTENLPKGNGRALRLELFVEWSATAEGGIPAGTYTAARRVGGGISKADIVPFRMVTGQHDHFMLPSGTWWQTFDQGAWGETYACIDDGTVKVERPDGGYRIEFDLIDCNDPAYRIKGTWESRDALEVYVENTYAGSAAAETAGTK